MELTITTEADKIFQAMIADGKDEFTAARHAYPSKKDALAYARSKRKNLEYVQAHMDMCLEDNGITNEFMAKTFKDSIDLARDDPKAADSLEKKFKTFVEYYKMGNSDKANINITNNTKIDQSNKTMVQQQFFKEQWSEAVKHLPEEDIITMIESAKIGTNELLEPEVLFEPAPEVYDGEDEIDDD